MQNKPKIFKYAIANSMLTVFYVVLIALFFSNAQSLFGDTKSPLIPMAMLLLFVFSAALCGTLVFGRPILWYVEGRKNDALKLFSFTILLILLVVIIIFTILYSINHLV